jgi:hypothetical protein
MTPLSGRFPLQIFVHLSKVVRELLPILPSRVVPEKLLKVAWIDRGLKNVQIRPMLSSDARDW